MILRIAGLLSMMALAAAAQDGIMPTVVPLPGTIDADQMKLELRQLVSRASVVGVKSAVMGPAVKGAPYSAVEVAENTQVLSDGTHIDRQTQTNVYRDSEGRMRHETPDQVTIWDPVAGVSYILDPKTQAAHKMMVNSYVGPSSGNVGVHVLGSGPDVAYVARGRFGAGGALPLPPPDFVAEPNLVYMSKDVQRLAGKSESLGSQTIEGVSATGTRMTSTIEVGAIGNDRAIQIVSESWYSPELQTMVKSSHNDPRMGQETFELRNISRTEPSADLFQVPAGYQIVGPK
jgi:hypothetical protein